MKKYTLIGQKGFAMVMTLFLVVAVMAVSAGSFLAMARHQRTTQLEIERVKTRWAAEGAIDKALHLFYAHVRTVGGYPSVEDSEALEGSSSPVIDDGPFHKDHKNWYRDNSSLLATPGFTDGMILDSSDYPYTEGPSGFIAIHQIGSSSGGKLDDDPLDSHRIYQIKARVTHPHTQVKTYLSQTFKLSASKLFDYSVFYDKDLEIAPGPSATIQGPIFSNGNIYLMASQGNTLTLKAPDLHWGLTALAEDYVIESAKNIYFGFKRDLGSNYLLEDSVYKDAVDDFFIGSGVYLGRKYLHSALAYLEGNETRYYEPFQAQATGWDHPPVPYFYFYRNDAILATPSATNPASPYSKINLLQRDNDIIELTGPIDDPATRCSPITRWGAFYPDFYNMFTHYPARRNAAYELSGPTYEGISISPAFNSSEPFTRPPQEIVPFVNQSSTLEERTQGDFKERVEPKALTVGMPSGASVHSLIEPLKEECLSDPCDPLDPQNANCDCPVVRSAKLESKANIVITCNGVPDCDIEKGNPPGGLINRIASMWDYRMARRVNVVEVNISVLAPSEHSKQTLSEEEKNGKFLYIKTDPPENWAVVLTNAEKIPALAYGETSKIKGFSLATNARLWIKGNYNIFAMDYDPDQGYSYESCSYQEITGGHCNVPPAAIFSDSIGILSPTAGYDGWDKNTALSDRIATADDVSVNAAIVSGYLPSQLRARYPRNPNTLKRVTTCGDEMENCIGLVSGHSPRVEQSYRVESYAKIPATRIEKDNGKYYMSKSDPRYLAALGRPDSFQGQVWAQDPSGADRLPLFTGDMDVITSVSPFSPRHEYLTDPIKTKLLAPPEAIGPYPGVDFGMAEKSYRYGYCYMAYQPQPLFFFREYNILKTAEGRCEPQGRMYYAQHAPYIPGSDKDPDRPCESPQVPFQPSCVATGAEVNDNHYDSTNPDHNKIARQVPAKELFQMAGWHECGLVGSGRYDSEGACNGSSGAKESKCDGNPHLMSTTDLSHNEACVNKDYPVNQNGELLGPGGSVVQLWRDFAGGEKCFWRHENIAPYKDYLRMAFCDREAVGGCNKVNCFWLDTGETVPNEYVTSVFFVPFTTPNYPQLMWYSHWRHMPLYDAMSSGGLENLVNYQEDWDKKSVKFSGVLTAPWDSEELKDEDGEPAYYGLDYYQAPDRFFDYNEGFLIDQPPGTPNLYSIKRKAAKELNPYEVITPEPEDEA